MHQHALLRALLGLVPCRTANKTSARAIAAIPSIVATKVAVPIEASEPWWSIGSVVVVIDVVLVVLLLPSFLVAKLTSCQDDKMPS